VGGLSALLIGLPWHEYVVMAGPYLSAWKELVLAAILVAVVARRWERVEECPWLFWVVTFGGVCICSALANDQSLLPARPLVFPMLAGLAAFTLRSEERDRILRGFLLSALVVVGYALVAHVAFRWCGGAPHYRPAIANPLLRALAFPYYTPNYSRGDRLIGPFLNDDYFGIWCVAVLALLLAESRWRIPAVLAVLTAAVWTYSRSALCAFGAAGAVLAWRRDRRVLWLIPIGLGLAVIFWTSQQGERFQHPIDTGIGRVVAVQQAGRTLASGSLLGEGPAANQVYDMQYARLVYQLGWAGLAMLGWLGFILYQRVAHAGLPVHVGLAAACLALLVGGVGCEVLEVPQTSWTWWILLGLLGCDEDPDP
jgi:hypothetical protein